LAENLKLDCLPKYVSDNPDTMPSVRLYEGDLAVLIKAIEKMKSRMDEFRSQLSAIASEVQVLSTAKRPEASSDVRANKDVGSLMPTEVTAGSSSRSDSDTAGHSYADEFPKLPNAGETESVPDPQGWKLVTRHRPSSPKTSAVTKPTLRLRGLRIAASDDSTVKAVGRKPVLAAFVGRIHKDTTAEQLKVYLEAEGMKGVTCRKLPEKPEFRFRTSAFYVPCGNRHRQ